MREPLRCPANSIFQPVSCMSSVLLHVLRARRVPHVEVACSLLIAVAALRSALIFGLHFFPWPVRCVVLACASFWPVFVAALVLIHALTVISRQILHDTNELNTELGEFDTARIR